jgi:hypothetical protein
MEPIDAGNSGAGNPSANEPRNFEGDRRIHPARQEVAYQYDRDIEQLRTEKRELEDLLNNSGPVRLWWLKATRRVSGDPHRDLNLLQSTLEMKEKYRTLGPRAAMGDAGRGGGDKRQPTERIGITREQAREFIELMEDNGARPASALRAFADEITGAYEPARLPDEAEELDEDFDIPY